MEYDDNLKLIVLDNCKDFGNKVNEYLTSKRRNYGTYIVPIEETKFKNGDGRIIIKDSVRKKDTYIISDVGNYNCTYDLCGYENKKSPDDHFQDIKRVISAIKGHASNITVVMPLLYASRQHKRKGRESLDCAIALQELERMGVDCIITFDAHDPSIQNAVPLMAFENFYVTHNLLSSFVANEGITSNKNLIVVGPDMGASDRARLFADMLEANVGMSYKRRDLTKIVDGKHPIAEHKYIGVGVKNKDVIIVDDMIASGTSILDVAIDMKKRGAKKVFLISTFGLFTNGIKKFEEAYNNQVFDRLYTTNLTYCTDEIKENDWFFQVDCTPYLGEIIHRINCHQSISEIMNQKVNVLTKVRRR